MRFLTFCACAFMYLLAGSLTATDYTWQGVTDDWYTLTNWTPNTGSVPGTSAGDTVTIGSDNPAMPVLVTASDPQTLLTLYGLTIQSEASLTLAGDNLSVISYMVVDPGGFLYIGSSDGQTAGSLGLAGPVTISGGIPAETGQIIFSANPLNSISLLPVAAGSTVTIGYEEIHGSNGTINVTGANGTMNSLLDIEGATIACDDEGGGGAITLNVNDWLNNGFVTSTEGNSLVLNATGSGVINSSGVVYVDNNPAVPYFSTTGGTLTVTGGSWTYCGTGVLYANDGTLNLGGIWEGLPYTYDEGEFNENDQPSSINATNSTVNLGGSFLADDAYELAYNSSYSTFNIIGTLDNSSNDNISNGNFDLWSANQSNFYLLGGTILGGTIVDESLEGGMGTIFGTDSGGTLTNVTIDSTVLFDLGIILNDNNNYASCTVTGGLTVNGLFTVGDIDSSSAGVLTWSGSQIWNSSVSGAIQFSYNYTNSITQDANTPNCTLTIGPDLTVDGAIGTISANEGSSSTLVNQGTLSPSSSGYMNINVDNWVNIGQITGTSGASIYINGNSGINESGVNLDGVLTSGMISAAGGSVTISSSSDTPWINTVVGGVSVTNYSNGYNETGSLNITSWNDLAPGLGGLILNNGTTLQVSGTMTTTQLMGIVNASGNGIGAVDIYGQVTVDDSEIPLNVGSENVDSPTTWTLEDGGSLFGVEISNDEITGTLVVLGSGSRLGTQLNGVTIDAGATVAIEQGYNAGQCTIQNGLTIDGVLQIGVEGTAGIMSWMGSQSWTGNGYIVFGPAEPYALEDEPTIYVVSSINDASTASDDDPTPTLTLEGYNGDEQLTIEGGIATTNDGGVTVTGGGSGNVTTLPSDALSIQSNVNVTISGGSTFAFTGGTWSNYGAITIASPSDSLTITADSVGSGSNYGGIDTTGSLTINGGGWENFSSITGEAGSTVILGGQWSNYQGEGSGTMSNLGASSFQLGGSFSSDELAGNTLIALATCTFTITGTMLSAPGDIIDLSLGGSDIHPSWVLDGGTIDSGTLSDGGNGTGPLLTVSSSSLNALIGVTVGTPPTTDPLSTDTVVLDLTRPGAQCTVTNNFIVNSWAVVGGSDGEAASLIWQGSQYWGGQGVIAFGTSPSNSIADGNITPDPDSPPVLTIESPLTICAGNGSIAATSTGASLFNQGTITTQYNSGGIEPVLADSNGALNIALGSVNTFSNDGTLFVTSGAHVQVNGNYIQNDVGGEDPGGTVEVVTGTANYTTSLPATAINAVNVTGTATIGGTFNITWNDSDYPNVPTAFIVLSSAGTLSFTSTPAQTGLAQPDFTLDTTNYPQLVTLDFSQPTVAISTTNNLTTTTSSPLSFQVVFSTAIFSPSTPNSSMFTVVNGTVATITANTGMYATPNSYTVIVTPTGGATPEPVSLAFKAGQWNDAAGFANLASNTSNINFDIAPTIVAITTNTQASTNHSPVIFTLTFSQSVSLDASLMTITGGTAITSPSGPATTYTVTVVPATSPDSIFISVPGAAVQDTYGTTMVNAASATVSFDDAPLTATITPSAASTTTSPITFTVHFSTSLISDPAATVFTPYNGAVATITTDPLYHQNYTLTVTPAGAGGVFLELPSAVVQDAYGNLNQSAIGVTTYGTSNPSVVITPSSGQVAVLPVVFTLTFSSAVGPPNPSLLATSANDVLGPITEVGTSGLVYTVPVGTVGNAFGAVTLQVLAGATTDDSSQPNTASNIASVEYAAVTASTPVTVAVTPPGTTANSSPLVFTLAFSVPLSATPPLTIGDLVVTNGVATSITSSGDNVHFTVDVTPNGEGPVTLSVLPGVAQDSFGTVNLASPAATVIYHATIPTPAMTFGAKVPVAVPSFTLFVTFNEPVTGFTAAGVVFSGAPVTSVFSALSPTAYQVQLTPTAPISASVIATIPAAVCQDSFGNANPAVTITIPMQSSNVSTTIAAPVIVLSPANATLYNSLCPGTQSGLGQLQAFLNSSNVSQARGFVWDATAQAFVVVPEQTPTGGWQPYQGVLLASRVPANFNFNGFMTTFDFTLTLLPGWNFVGIPPLDNGEGGLTSHDWNNDLQLEDTAGAVISDRADIIDVGAWAWNASSSTYSQTTTLLSGIGYWIDNASSPPVNVVLRRLSPNEEEDFRLGAQRATQSGQGGQVRGQSSQNAAVTIGYTAHSSTPPQPPSGASQGDSSGHGCGLGSGIGALILALGLVLRLRLRSRR